MKSHFNLQECLVDVAIINFHIIQIPHKNVHFIFVINSKRCILGSSCKPRCFSIASIAVCTKNCLKRLSSLARWWVSVPTIKSWTSHSLPTKQTPNDNLSKPMVYKCLIQTSKNLNLV